MTAPDLDALIERLADPPLDDDAVCALAVQAAAALVQLRERVAELAKTAQREVDNALRAEAERDALAKDAEQSGTMLQWILSNAEYRLGVNSLGKPNYYVVPAEVIDAAKEKPPNDGFGEIDKRDGFGLAGKAVPPPGTSARDEWRGGCGKEKP
jgi:hypothetical protein